ncbi:ATP-binding protein [Streptomyces sp. NPDC090306]|uniref:ATP-binding protein n=1 Tax=unclassified Streptomyces TaxID=2593676 RepID=UPI0036E64D7B
MDGAATGEERPASEAVDLHATEALEGEPGCIAEARRFTRTFLTRARVEFHRAVSPRALECAQLVVSELTTNALKYAPGPLLLELRVVEDVVEITVWDTDPVLPVGEAADPERVGRHGLEIVLAVARSFEASREPVGKRVTARVALTDAPGGVLSNGAGGAVLRPE